MTSRKSIIASGNMATARRTISGLLGQISIFGCPENDAIEIIKAAGLPAAAYDDPDFPVSLQQDLSICNSLVASLPKEQNPASLIFSIRELLGVDSAGVLGMAMRTAATHEEATQLYIKHPQLSWGHCRILIRQDQEHVDCEFSIDRPSLRLTSEHDIDRLVEYCLTLDLTSAMQMTLEISAGSSKPIEIRLPFPRPNNWTLDSLPWAVQFDADVASLRYSRQIKDLTLPHSRPRLFKNYSCLVAKLSQILVDDTSMAEKVSRWLWAHTPPLSRAEVANLLAMSERNLTRKLKAESTSFSDLLGKVQDQRGKNLLRNPSLTIAEVAYRIGYTDPATFSRAFSRRNSLSPQQWRNAKSSLGHKKI